MHLANFNQLQLPQEIDRATSRHFVKVGSGQQKRHLARKHFRLAFFANQS